MKACRVLVCALALAGLWAAPGRAWAQAAVVAPAPEEGEESAELRALRLAELEVFAAPQPRLDMGAVLAAPGVVPDALTSDAPELTTTTGASGTTRDL